MSDPFVRHERICEGIGEDPYLYIIQLYVQFLQGLFNFLPAGQFHWEPDEEISEIIIRGEAPLNMQTVGKKPAITVVLGPTASAGIGINNLLEMNLSTGREVRSDLIAGTLVAYSLAESDIIALRLAHIISHHTRALQRLLESKTGFHAIARPFPTINSPSPPGALVNGDPEGLIMVQTNIPFQFQFTWATDPKQDRRLRSLQLITGNRRASDVEYTSPSKLERVELAMSTTPVFVRRISGSNARRPVVVPVSEGQRPFQLISLLPFGEKE
jgi:hypothetical protein